MKKTFLQRYIAFIKALQDVLVVGSVGIFLIILPIMLVFIPEYLPAHIYKTLYFISYASVTFVMAIRPLADIFSSNKYLRMLVPLRKGFGILSASIIVSFLLQKVILQGVYPYFSKILSASYWSFSKYYFFAHLGDITAIILLATSNVFSKKILGKNWKRIQKLAYVYFYSGGLYEVLAFNDVFAAYALTFVSFLLLFTFFIKKIRTYQSYENYKN